ncbi:MAG: DUF2249 domain-containing protein [Coriobacteriales bacterium]|nr:DUF2249 domain-containing protein [Coriobacteriales bacterium]
MPGRSNAGLVVDIRGLEPNLRRPMVFCVVDKYLELGGRDHIMLITDHEPAGLGYQLDLRRETRGRLSFEYDRRASDGAWIAFIRRAYM